MTCCMNAHACRTRTGSEKRLSSCFRLLSGSSSGRLVQCRIWARARRRWRRRRSSPSATMLYSRRDIQRRFLYDPSLNDPSLNDPSLNDPSLYNPSLNNPSLNNPSLYNPSLIILPL